MLTVVKVIHFETDDDRLHTAEIRATVSWCCAPAWLTLTQSMSHIPTGDHCNVLCHNPNPSEHLLIHEIALLFVHDPHALAPYFVLDAKKVSKFDKKYTFWWFSR